MNGADVVAEILRREGTDFLSAYPRNPLIESCAALDIRPIFCRQERVGVGLADGYSRIKRGKKNGVFAAQAGPGIENAFPGVAQAYTENVPMLMIPAGLPLSKQYVKPTFRASDVYRPVTKWSALAHNVQELPDLMRRAYQALRTGKGGPVMAGSGWRSSSLCPQAGYSRLPPQSPCIVAGSSREGALRALPRWRRCARGGVRRRGRRPMRVRPFRTAGRDRATDGR
jgi:hypothetical protein